MTKPCEADKSLFFALSSAAVPRDIADVIQARLKLRDVVAAANRIVTRSRQPEWQAKARELFLGPNRPAYADGVRNLCNQIAATIH